jgi:hypothetical protein
MANKLSVHVVSLGDQRQPISFPYLKNWKSDIFEVVECSTLDNVPDADGGAWEYPDTQLESLVCPSSKFDLTLIIVAAPVQSNFYSRRLSRNRAVISLHEMSAILTASNIRIEDFLIQRLYALSIYFQISNGALPTSSGASLSHHAIRTCLFDMNANKSDIIYSMHRPTLCPACQAAISQKPLPTGFIERICKELKKIRRPRYYLIADWVKCHPFLAIVVTAFASLFLNVLSNAIFEKLKRCWSFIA